MKIQINELPFAFDNEQDDPTIEARRIADAYDVQVTLTGKRRGAWPEASVIGTPEQVIKAYLEAWTSGDDENDYELLYHFLKDAQEVFG